MCARGDAAYVYFVCGMFHQFNVVTGRGGSPHAVLIRAVEPVEGIDTMRRRRRGQPDGNLTSGPGKLCIALGIDRGHDRADLLGRRAFLEEGLRAWPPYAIGRGRPCRCDYASSSA